MAGKGSAVGVGRTYGNGNGASHAAGTELTHAVASEFDRSMNKASYIDDTPVPVIVMDCDHTIEYLNRAAALLAGIAPESCLGLKLWDVFDNEACRNGSCLATRAMREGHTVAGNTEFVVKGRKMPFRSCVSPRYDEQNKIIGIVQVVQDNSEEQRFADEISRLVRASHDGQLSERGKAEDFQGRYRDLVTEVNAMLDAILLPIGEGNRILAQISNGKIDESIAQTYKGDHEKMKQAVNNVATVLQGLQKELARLTDASRDGQLSERGKPEQFMGAYADVVEGVNQMLDAILLPIGEGNRILAQISNGKIDELIAQTYKGDHEKMKQAVNTVATVLQNLVADTNMLTKAALEGKLSTRADASLHHGDFRKIVEGVNSTLDAVVGPLQDVSAVLTKIAGGDFTTLVTNKYLGDFDLLADAVNTLSKSVRSALEQIGRNVSLLASSSEELNKVSQSMGSNADETATQANVVSAAAEQVSNNVQTVATGAEEMSASIKEIAKNTAEASRVATSAVRTAEVTNVTISKLGQSSAEIGQVIKVITSIAQQTNLLALNATIEAARAGEAGKGFAVVANEVKELAKETAKATEDISRKIEAIQGDTNGAVSAISQISQVIGQISDIQTTIASAIEEQSATTNEIGRTLAEAAKGSTDISKNIGGVADAARATTVGATDTSKSAHSLEKMAAELQTLVSQFRY